MKRRLIIFLTSATCITCVISYNAFFSPWHPSNNSYAHEYYYNNDDNKDDLAMKYLFKNSMQNNISIAETADLKPDSITVLVNKEFGLPSDYIPDDLIIPDILYDFNYYDEKKLLRQEAADAIEDLFQAASDEGLNLYAVSGYRSYVRQKQIYENNLKTKGAEHTNKYSARPGHSEHQSGLVMDVSTPSIGNRLEEVFEGTPEGKWLANNAWKYGFIIRYPKDKTNITGYSYEPWHIRYVGKPLAKYIFDHNLTLEEYYNYTPSKEFLELESSYDSVPESEETSAGSSPAANSEKNSQNANGSHNSNSKPNKTNQKPEQPNTSIKDKEKDTVKPDDNKDNNKPNDIPNKEKDKDSDKPKEEGNKKPELPSTELEDEEVVPEVPEETNQGDEDLQDEDSTEIESEEIIDNEHESSIDTNDVYLEDENIVPESDPFIE